jgi:hypothetical protein
MVILDILLCKLKMQIFNCLRAWGGAGIRIYGFMLAKHM